MLVRRGCHRDPGDEVAAAYDAPFPNAASKAGARAFPGLIPQRPDAPGAAAGKRVLEALRDDERPLLMLWAEQDPVLPPKVGEAFARALGRPAPRPVPEAGHFLQEDQGPLVGATIADWLGSGARQAAGGGRGSPPGGPPAPTGPPPRARRARPRPLAGPGRRG